MNVIELENIKKVYGKNIAVNIDNMFIKKGEVYGLIGPNGAGKSTLMKMICGLKNPTQGEVKINGKYMNESNRSVLLKEIGSLIESPSYYDNLSGYENMLIVKELKDLKEDDINKALSIVGLTSNKNKKVKHYSLGMKQRLGIAMAIIGMPKIIILDEPTNGLDPQARREIRDLICKLPKEYDTTIMVSSHALDEIEKMVTQIGIIGNGNLLYEGTVSEFKNLYGGNINIETSNNKLAFNIIGDDFIKIENNALKLPFVSNDEIGKIVKKLVESKIEVYRIYDLNKSLEDLFLKFTEKETL